MRINGTRTRPLKTKMLAFLSVHNENNSKHLSLSSLKIEIASCLPAKWINLGIAENCNLGQASYAKEEEDSPIEKRGDLGGTVLNKMSIGGKWVFPVWLPIGWVMVAPHWLGLLLGKFLPIEVCEYRRVVVHKSSSSRAPSSPHLKNGHCIIDRVGGRDNQQCCGEP